MIKKEIEQKAIDLIGDLIEFPVKIIKLIEDKTDYEVLYFDDINKDKNIAGRVDHDKKKIYVNQNDKPERIRFTLAHELGHIILHSDNKQTHFRIVDIKQNELELYVDKTEEFEANYFAGCLLMPKDKFIEIWNLYNGYIDDIARYFIVSKLAVNVRANILGLLFI